MRGRTAGTAPELGTGRVPQGQVLLVACSGAFLAFLDATIVNVAFPSIRESFDDTSIGDLSWVLNAYNIVFAAFLVVFGRLADLLGRRRTFVWGVAVFTVASVACGLATSVEVLVAARVLQALGAALLVPASLALVVQAFEPERRGHAIGLWGASAAVAAGLGPPAGGALVELGGWRWAFLVNLPLGIAAVVAARRTLVESRAPGRRRLPDLRGAALLAAAVGLLNLAIVKGEDWGWTSLATTGTAVASLLLLGGFVLSSRHHRSPLLDPELLRIRSFSVANVATLLAGLGFFAYLLTNVLWLQYVWGYSVLRAGLALMPGALVAAVVATLVAPVAERRGARAVVVPGALVWAAAYVWYAQRAGLSPAFLTEWLPGQVLSGIGAGAVLPVLGSAAMAAVPGGRFATASAVVSSARQLGGVVGIAVLVVIVGVPTPQTVVGSLQDGWLLSIAAFVLVAVLALPLGRPVPPPAEVPEEGDVPKVHLPARPSAQDGASDRAAAGLAPVPMFAALGPQARAHLDRTARTVTLAAGQVLLEEGDPADAVYVLQTGRLEVLVGGRLVRELAPGAVLGELAVLTGGRRSATVRARRDATLLEVTAADFDALLLDDPAAARVVTAQLAQRLATPPPVRAARPARPAVVAVVPLHRGADAAAVADALVAHLARTARVVQLDGADAEAVERAERTGALVVLTASAQDDAGRDFAVREADQVVLVADPSAEPGSVGVSRTARRPDLVLVGRRPAPDVLTAWSTALDPWQITVVDGPVPAGVRALADRISGRAVGLVLAGGGARGFAHLGVLRELQEAGVRVDRVAGCSIGAAIAAGHAAGMGSDELEARGYQEWVRRRPFGDYTVPLVSLARGRRFEASLARCVGADIVIEGLPGQFRCVSTDLATRSRVVHDRGRLVSAVRASVGIPVLLPPVVDGSRLLVDGGVLDNLPVDVLTERDEGPVVAVNISMGGSGGTPPAGNPRAGAARRVRVPALGETLIRTMTIGSGGAVATAREHGAYIVTPATLGVGLLEFHQFDLMVEAGRAAARALLERTGGDLLAAVEPPTSTVLPEPRVHAPAGRARAVAAPCRCGGTGQRVAVDTPLNRAITGRLLFLFVLGDVLGAGIYALLGGVAAETGGALWAPLLLALGLALLTAGSYAELVTKHPRAGGAAVFARRAYGSPLVAFVVGFCMAAAGMVSVAALALAFSGEYLAELVAVPQVPAAVVFLVLVGLLNARGIRESLRANVVMTVVEVVGLLLVVVLGVLVVASGDGDVGRVTEFRDGTSAPLAVLGGALLAYYSFVGFETSANVAEETQDVRRTYPRALFGSLLVAGAAYVLVGLAVSAAVPTDVLAESSGPLLEVVRASGTGLPPELFSLIALIAVANGALLTSVMASRLLFGMARDGLLPPVLGRVLPRRRTPGVAVAVTIAVAVLLATTGGVTALAETVVLLLLVVFVSTNLAVLVLRRERTDAPHFRVWTPVPVLGLVSCVVLATQQSAGTWLRAGLLVLVGLVLYGVSRASGATGQTAEPYPDEAGAPAPARTEPPVSP